VPHIVPFLHSDRPELRASAAWALKRIGTEDGRRAVAEALVEETDPAVRAEMTWAVGAQKEEMLDADTATESR
jgi:epoxyqueuosine reductase